MTFIRNTVILNIVAFIVEIQSNLHGLQSQPVIATSMAAHELGFILTEKTLSYPPFQKILHSNESFDLVMTEEFAIPGLLGVAAHFNAKSMLVNSLRTGTWSNYYFGNPEEPSTIPYVFSRYVPPMSLLERCRNLLDIIAEYFMREWIMLPKQDEILHKYLPHVPKVQELVRSQSLMLVNSHVSFELPVPMLPNIVEIGGYHVEEPKPLQKDLKKVLDEAEDGIIFFSLGTNIQSSDLKTQKIEAVINVFSKLKQIVLWKYENQSIVNKPRNLLTGSWFPQNDILGKYFRLNFALYFFSLCFQHILT